MVSFSELRELYLKHCEGAGYVRIPSASLIPQNDPTTLFTGSGMQPLVPYLLGKDHPLGTRVANSQKCFRSMDIEEVGDNRHTTFFEMLGNWSLGECSKKEQLPLMFEFLVDKLGLDANHLYVTCFIGAPEYGIEKDTEAAEIWQQLFESRGIRASIADIGTEKDGYARGVRKDERIFYYDGKKNWWNRGKTGPQTTAIGDPCGPDSEMFYEFTDIEHDPKFGEHCHPNCDCGRFMEIGNNVFMTYKKEGEGKFVQLERPNIDHGSGLERIAAAAANSSDIFPVVHALAIRQLEEMSNKKYADDERSFRIIADHIRAAVFLIADGVLPSNADQGYFVRRLIRRSVRFADKLELPPMSLGRLIAVTTKEYEETYPELSLRHNDIETAIDGEENKFRSTLVHGMKMFERISNGSSVSGEDAYTLFTTHGFPIELIEEIAQEQGGTVDHAGFDAAMERHRADSRAGAEQKFKGGLADSSEATTRLHTAHHLLLKALQMVLGPHVHQRGSNITAERLRIDFSHGEKMTDEQKKEVERIVNEKMQESLPVIVSTLKKEEAEKLHAEHEFGATYPETVTVYSIGPKEATREAPVFEGSFSIEFCGGPHVENTNELSGSGSFKILKEEASSAGVRRIKATLVR